MPKTGVLIETENGGVKAINYGLLTAAMGNKENEVIAFITQNDAAEAKDDLAAYGVSKVVQLKVGSGDINSSPDLCARALAAAVEEFELDHIAGLATAPGRDIFGRLGAILDVPLVSDIQSIDYGAETAVKSHFSGKTMATVKLEGSPVVFTVRPNAVDPVENPVDAETAEFNADVADGPKVTVKEVKASQQDKMELTEAPVIITGGRPIGAPDNYKMLDECAEVLGAAVGASRASVDAGFAPHSMQVGQTGKTVSPNLYIACGVSGAVQHFAGMKTSKVIVAINNDKDAPIFEKCDYGIIGDMFEVVPVLTEVLKASEEK
ncbi:MAG: electron transfer flavoprotein subunit alpha/FixB family protein [Desulfarculaceae bacterium]|nr:electron transfer flavoprotein subunit alpha/FixB family protein [Desulfarculaceae bacterium]